MKSDAATAVLLIIVVIAVSLAGCGGGSSVMPGTDNAPATASDLAALTAGLTALQTADLTREAPVDMAEVETMGGASAIYSQPQLWRNGRWVSLAPYSGKKRFLGPLGYIASSRWPVTR